MMLKLKYPVLLIILSIIFYSCEKEYSIEGNAVGGTAVFSFTGSPGVCTNAVVTGTYQPGIALGATNVVTLSVDVTAVGTYTITTATVDDMSFTGSGSFTTIGTQTISLTGSGIPTAGFTGPFSFTTGNNGCSFIVTVSGGGGTSGGTATYTLNGAPGSCTSFSPGGTYAAGTALGTGNTATVSVNVATIGTYIISTNTVNGISFSGTGTFTATGTQLVQLTGTGTPLVGGDFEFIPGTNGCRFSITVTGGGSSAVFTYDGAPNSCTTATPAGTYISGTALTTANTVTINVNVTTIGTWSISTSPADGFSFSGSGSFTAPGTQSVVLTGTGTPALDGVFDFTPSNGCIFSITVTTGTVVTDFLKCTLGGVATTFNSDLVGASPDATTFTITGFESSATNAPGFQITLINSATVTPGTYERFSLTNGTVYCIVEYNDGVTPTSWVTGLTQAGGFTVIVTSKAGNRIQGTFSGTLYDNNGLGTGPLVIENGEFSLPYQ